MPYLQFVYESVASDSLVEADVLDILRKSQVRNNQAGISGILLFHGRRFLQFIEGPAGEVERLVERIGQDPRHREIRVLEKTESGRLVMPTWAMAYTSPAVDRIPAGDSFMLRRREAQAICELLPPHVARPFLDLLASDTEAS